MFKSLKLKQMGLLANQLVKSNQDVFDKFRTNVTVISSTYHTIIRKIGGEEFISPIRWTGYPRKGPKLQQLNTVIFCMNSMYEIAKYLKKDPIVFVEETINEFCDYVRSSKCPVI